MNQLHKLARALTLDMGKRTVLLATGLLLLVAISSRTNAQCLQNSFSPGRLYKSTGDPRLDTSFNQEGNLLYVFFGVSPNLLIFDDGQSPNAMASPENTLPGYTGTVYFGIGLLRSELWTMNKGGYAVAGIMAHEFAHILQIRRNGRLSGKYRELHADYMAGYYLGRKSYIAPTNIQAFAESLYEKGDYDFWSPSHHGTPEERVGAMVTGFGARNSSLSAAFSKGERYVRGDDSDSDNAGEPGGIEQCMQRKQVDCPDFCVRTYGFSYVRCKELCLPNNDNVAGWRRNCEREIKRRTKNQ